MLLVKEAANFTLQMRNTWPCDDRWISNIYAAGSNESATAQFMQAQCACGLRINKKNSEFEDGEEGRL